jgi:hypothetical protein
VGYFFYPEDGGSRFLWNVGNHHHLHGITFQKIAL